MAYYLDLDNSGVSVLAAITGSAVRPDVTSQLAVANVFPGPTGYLTNSALLTVTSASLTQVNVTHVALYSAPTGGALTLRAPVGAYRTIAKGNPVRFPALGLSFLDLVFDEMISELGVIMISERSDAIVIMITETLQT